WWGRAERLNGVLWGGGIVAWGSGGASGFGGVCLARRRGRAGEAAPAAMASAARGRLRPILMTTMAMVAGMIPMALGLGASGTETAPLGLAVIGGLAGSSLSTLLILPAVYVLVSGAGPARSDSLDPDDPESVNYDGDRS